MTPMAHVDQQNIASVAQDHSSGIAVSVVVPVTEYCDDLTKLYAQYATILNRGGYTFEFVFVIDSKWECFAEDLHVLIDSGAPIKLVMFTRCFGESTALMVGFEQARGEVVVTLPAYGQTVPEGIDQVLNTLAEGYDLVVTRRWPRRDSLINRIQTKGFHLVTGFLTGVHFQDSSCGLKGLTKRVIRELQLYGDLHRFIPFLAYQKGFRIAEIDVQQDPANSKTRIYRPGVYLRRMLDILTLAFLFKFTKKPLRFFGLIGGGLFASGSLLTLSLGVQKLLGWTALSDRPLLLLGVLLMVLGVQTGSIGLLGEIIVFTHARKLKEYSVERILR